MAILSLFVGVAFFRIRHVTFAIGTMGLAIIAQMVVNSAVGITGGSLCSLGVKRPLISIPFTDIVFKITKPYQYYYLLLPIAALLFLLIWAVNNSRTGRAFIAVREDEIRAAAIGINPLRYKLIAFALSGFAIGALGSFQAQYLTVVCPSELGLEITNTLMIMVFVGGVGKMRGVIIGAILFSVLPRFLEVGGERAITPQLQQIAFGLILILVTIYLPNGLDSIISRFEKKGKKSKTSRPEKLS
jgi:branched-chain amino acid transport system permease protein